MPSDDDTTPKLGRIPGVPPRRFQSQTERDHEGLAALRERNAKSREGTVFVDEDLTGKHDAGEIDGDELRRRRNDRPTPQRVGHLEDRVDGLSEDFANFRVEHARDLGGVASAIGSLTGEVSGLKTVIETSQRREHVRFKGEVEVDTAERLDGIDAKKTKRRIVKQVLAIMSALIALATAAFAAGRC